MATATAAIATVTEISGRAWVRQADGSLTELRPGATIPAHSEIVTGAGSSVSLAIDGAAPITLGADRSVAITDDLLVPTAPSDAAIRAEMADSARLLAALESDDDPFSIAEATAAIASGPGGDDGGGSFSRVLRINESVFDAPSDLAASTRVSSSSDQDLTRFNGEVFGDNAALPFPAIPTPPAPPSTTDPGDNPAPEIARLQVLEDHSLTGNVLNGATNASGDPLSIVQFSVNGQFYSAGETAVITDASRPEKWRNVGTLTMDDKGEYTFTPSADWNGTVPDVTVFMTDGSELSMDKLAIEVVPVNDQPASLHTVYNAAAATTYVFGEKDFPLRDLKDSDVIKNEDLANAPPTNVIITSLHPYGGTLMLDGHPVTVGAVVSLADLQAGKFVLHVPEHFTGGGLMPFTFRVQDDGGTENGGVDTSNQYVFRLNVSQLIIDDNYSNKTIYGGSGKDIVIGDAGGVTERHVDADADLNIALLLDVNAFNREGFSQPSDPLRAEVAIKNALHALLNDQLLTHAGKVNVSLMTFDKTGSVNQISITDLNVGNIQSILSVIDGLHGASKGQADYTPAFNEAKAWFEQMASQGYGDYQNQTFFLTGSTPIGNLTDQAHAFNALKQVSDVHAIDTQHRNPNVKPSDTYRIAQYDTTDTHMAIDRLRYVTHADFQSNTGASNLSAWEVSGTGGGDVFLANGRLNIRSESPSDYVGNRNTVVTQSEAHKMVVTDPDGAYFSFSLYSGNQRYLDMYNWRLLQWDASANNGQGDWVVAQQGGDSLGRMLWDEITITTSHHPPGEYRFEFEVAGMGFYGSPGSLAIDNIRIHKAVLEGTPQYVSNQDDLNAALSINSTIVNSMGDDQIELTTVGASIAFGDAMNTDGLPWGENGNPVKPTDKHGVDALAFFLEATLGHPPTHEDMFDYIWANHGLFNVADDTHGGKDIIQGGQWSSLIYGGGGNDELFAGIDGDNILYGGAGNDFLSGTQLGKTLIIGGPGDDQVQLSSSSTGNTLVWLDGDAGSVGRAAMDRVNGFKVGRDTIDLSDLLIGEEDDDADLTDYLHVKLDGSFTLINISTTGELHSDGSNFDQQIRVGIDLTSGLTDQQDIINALINNGTLKVDT